MQTAGSCSQLSEYNLQAPQNTVDPVSGGCCHRKSLNLKILVIEPLKCCLENLWRLEITFTWQLCKTHVRQHENQKERKRTVGKKTWESVKKTHNSNLVYYDVIWCAAKWAIFVWHVWKLDEWMNIPVCNQEKWASFCEFPHSSSTMPSSARNCWHNRSESFEL